ncbi:PREDICTED: P-selectin glycoprotein ligand 1 isoform X2 [Mandrillus leucophaeus]|nr:PREDICTED: P-selectin glycoprotein ligand 1 isoform X2 [Mandrillus leucophaeus]XP_011830958.1 PREDICTED: P-selectin glycoprotein ligand 1 isoform X2 [Mandrillus leucophaeus]XP_011830959.1 PREDICTED: P-selectin glycoprotein ligand 1 isoform X2 [Mandrillus leucophaeus]XP_011830960.1 PREDICTED: P-selectin glycoprotein ligand 1 isoform X2 [Mandrillus leucophaeus]
MPLQLLLLLILLGPGSSLQLWGTWADEAKKALGPLLARNRRQATEYEYLDYDFLPETEPPEILSNSTNTTPLTGPGNPESTTVKPAARHSTGLDTGGSVTELTMELANMGTLSMDSAAMEVQTTHPAATEAQTTQPAATEAQTTPLAATEAQTTPLAATEALTTQLVATEAQTTPLAATEAQTTQPIATEAQTTPLAATEALSTESNAMEALSTEPNATEALSMEPTTKKGLFIPFSVSSVTHKGIPMAASNLSINHPVGSPDHISVKQCLLGILILALVATIFLVCTVVLAVRLSRKGHMYPVRNYSPTEMVCISSLLPDGGEGPSALANGGLPKAKSQGLTPEPGEDRDGDDLTLHSFLP